MPRALARNAAICSTLVALVACSGTTYDESLASTTAPSTTAVLPTGSATEVLPILLAEVTPLDRVIREQGDKQAAITRIVAMWETVAGEVETERRELFDDFVRAIDLAERSVAGNRPADADKAERNLSTLVELYLAG
jgi:hypothetical protein